MKGVKNLAWKKIHKFNFSFIIDLFLQIFHANQMVNIWEILQKLLIWNVKFVQFAPCLGVDVSAASRLTELNVE